eukprot:GHVQ01043605.1.p1 GENE.GHVQ01043605.1~~GHVQ01043605.1.p1  ORF type:complete len:195 (+),score=39.62 GHVQ01043605.1:359-943(+)
MAPKKAPPSKQNDAQVELDVENELLKRRVQVLQQKLMIKDEQISKSKDNQNGQRVQVEEINKQLAAEAENSKDLTEEMRRQHNEMRQSFENIINNLGGQVATAKQEIEAVQEEIRATQRKTNEIAQTKDDEINGLKSQMEAMTYEFSGMLQNTLEKMTHRIEVTHISWESDHGKAPLINRLKEFSLTDEAQRPR